MKRFYSIRVIEANSQEEAVEMIGNGAPDFLEHLDISDVVVDKDTAIEMFKKEP